MPARPHEAQVRVRALGPADRTWHVSTLEASWGATTVARRGGAVDAATLPGLVALDDAGVPCGLATYQRGTDTTELVTIDATRKGHGVGTALLRALATQEAQAGMRRIWLVTTNDNLDALRFYQRRGLRLVAVHPGAVAEARRLKPSIPLIGRHGIPIRDELELELDLRGAGTLQQPS